MLILKLKLLLFLSIFVVSGCWSYHRVETHRAMSNDFYVQEWNYMMKHKTPNPKNYSFDKNPCAFVALSTYFNLVKVGDKSSMVWGVVCISAPKTNLPVKWGYHAWVMDQEGKIIDNVDPSKTGTLLYFHLIIFNKNGVFMVIQGPVLPSF